MASSVWHVTERTLTWQNGYGCILEWNKAMLAEVLNTTEGSLASVSQPSSASTQPRTEHNKLVLMKRSAGLAVWSPVEVFLAHRVVSVTLQYGCKATKMNLKWIKMAQEDPSEIEKSSSRNGIQRRAGKVILWGLGEPCPWSAPTRWGCNLASRTACLWPCLFKPDLGGLHRS